MTHYGVGILRVPILLGTREKARCTKEKYRYSNGYLANTNPGRGHASMDVG